MYDLFYYGGNNILIIKYDHALSVQNSFKCFYFSFDMYIIEC